jgi:hypothetical protein
MKGDRIAIGTFGLDISDKEYEYLKKHDECLSDNWDDENTLTNAIINLAHCCNAGSLESLQVLKKHNPTNSIIDLAINECIMWNE